MNLVNETRAAKELRGVLGLSEPPRRLVEVVTSKIVYELVSTMVGYKACDAALNWLAEVLRVGVPDALALAMKSVPATRAPKVYNLLSNLQLNLLKTEALVDSLSRVTNCERWWRFVVSSLLGSTDERYTGDLTFLTLYWQRGVPGASGFECYRLSGLGVCKDIHSLKRQSVAGFFSIVGIDPTVSNLVRRALEERLCLFFETVRVFGCGKLERLGTKRGSKISGEFDWLRPDGFASEPFEEVAQVPFVSDSKLSEFGGLGGLPVELSSCVWGPALVSVGGRALILDAIHPLLPEDVSKDWPLRNLLSIGSELFYLPVAVLVKLNSAKVVRELDTVWVRKWLEFQRGRFNVLVDVLDVTQKLVEVSFETVSGDEVSVVFPTLQGFERYSIREVLRTPSDFFERVWKVKEKNEGGLGVLLWMEPLFRQLDDFQIPGLGLYLSATPSEFTGGFESLYLKKGARAARLDEVRRSLFDLK